MKISLASGRPSGNVTLFALATLGLFTGAAEGYAPPPPGTVYFMVTDPSASDSPSPGNATIRVWGYPYQGTIAQGQDANPKAAVFKYTGSGSNTAKVSTSAPMSVTNLMFTGQPAGTDVHNGPAGYPCDSRTLYWRASVKHVAKIGWSATYPDGSIGYEINQGDDFLMDVCEAY